MMRALFLPLLIVLGCSAPALGQSNVESGRTETRYLATAGMGGYSLGFFADDSTVYELSTPIHGFDGEDRPALSLGIQQRKFHSKTFYTILGFNYERNPYEPPRGMGVGERKEESVVYAVLGIGNRWEWHFLNVGIDWINASVPALESHGRSGDAAAFVTPSSPPGVELRFLQIFVGVTF